MRKNILKMTVAVVALAAAGYCIYQNQMQGAIMSELTLANAEALAQDESVTINCSKECTDGIGQCWLLSNSGYCIFSGYMVDHCVC